MADAKVDAAALALTQDTTVPGSGSQRAVATGVPEKASGSSVVREEGAPEGYNSHREAYEALKAQLEASKAPKTEPAGDVRELAAKGGLDVAKLEKEYADNGGKLTPESMKALKDAGVTEEKLKAYVEAQQVINTAKATEYENAIYTEFEGGKEDFETLKTWAQASLTEEEQKEINKELLSGDIGRAKRVLREVVEAYEASQGVEPKLVTGAQKATSVGIKPFTSRAEVIKAMQSKEYKAGGEYARKVQERLVVSKGIGI